MSKREIPLVFEFILSLLRRVNMLATQTGTFSLAFKPLELKTVKSGESHKLTYKVDFQRKFLAKCILPKVNSQKFLYYSTSHSVCYCSLKLCQRN